MSGPSDQTRAFIRTMWPVLLGHIAAVLVAWVGTHVGVEIPHFVVFELLAVLLTGVVYAAGRWLERQSWGFARLLGRLILSYGRELGQPTYPRPLPESVPERWRKPLAR